MRRPVIFLLVAGLVGAAAALNLSGGEGVGEAFSRLAHKERPSTGAALPPRNETNADLTPDNRTVPLGMVATDSDRGSDAPEKTGKKDIAIGENVAQVSGGAGGAPPADRPPAVDETALRYFARQGDTKRLQAEIARLRALYPTWTPPADPLAVPPHADSQLDAMWQLYSQGRFAEVRKAIADRQTEDPAWQPPQDLLDRVAVAEARERLVNASNLKQYETVVRVASDTPSLLTCSEVDVLWRIAEAFALTDRQGRAKDAYLYVLHNCDDPGERLATVQKAIPLLPRDNVEDLLATERVDAGGKGEFESARADLVRRSVAAGGEDPKANVPPTDLASLEAIAQRDGRASDALLLGWYYVRRDNVAKAEEWFSKARAGEDSAEAAQGLALALIRQDRPKEAEDVLYRWRDASDEIRKLYLAAVANLLAIEPPLELEPSVLERVALVVAQARDAAAAQQFGWYARALDQHETAGQWFSTALAWKPDDEPSAYGLVLTRLQLGDNRGVSEIQRLWAGRSERIARLGEPERRPSAILPTGSQSRPGTATSPMSEQDRIAPTVPARSAEARADTSRGPVAARVERRPERRGCSKTDMYSSLKGEAALARGWCLMDLNRPAEAVAAFEAALSSGNKAVRRDAAWGQSLAYLRSGLTDEAAIAAAKAPQPRERSLELEASILSQRASGFFESGRYVETLLALEQRARIAPERRDLMALRGYAYLKLGRTGDARRVFQALAAAGDREGARGLAAVNPAKE